MSIARHIKEFLDSKQIPYQHGEHGVAYTAQETAHAQHVSGKELAKTVMVIADEKLLMAVLPATYRIDLDQLKKRLEADNVRLAAEKEFQAAFPGCDVGAMPPMGNLYHIDVWVDRSLGDHKDIVFNAGSHTDTIRMKYADFERVVAPHIARFADVIH